MLIKGCFNERTPITSVKVEGKKYEVIKYIIDTQYITNIKTKYIKGDSIRKDTTIYVSVPRYVDTSAILKDYYSINTYADTLKSDFGNITIKDTISKNKITGRSYSAVFKIPSVTTTQIVKQKFKPVAFVGLGGGITPNRSINEITANLFIQTSKRRIFGVGAGLNNNKPVYKFNILIKL
jgi:hypothetical protein